MSANVAYQPKLYALVTIDGYGQVDPDDRDDLDDVLYPALLAAAQQIVGPQGCTAQVVLYDEHGIAEWVFSGAAVRERRVSARVTDEYGRCTIPLNEAHNTPGEIVVDGDVYATGPVAKIEFTLSSDRIGADGEIDFGTFTVGMPSGVGATVNGCAILDEREARRLVAALLEQFDSEAENGQSGRR